MKTWLELIDYEDQVTESTRQEIWQFSVAEREARGLCVSNLKFDSIVNETFGVSDAVKRSDFGRYRCLLSFPDVKGGDNCEKLLKTDISIGDPIVISAMPKFFALAKGFLSQILGNTIEVLVDRDAQSLYQRICEIRKIPFVPGAFRIDKDEMSSGYRFVRGSLISLCMNKTYARLRDLIIHGKPPIFSDSHLSLVELKTVDKICDKFNFNKAQRSAIDKAIRAKDYSLILGMPGTGKSTLLAVLIFILYRVLGKRVLISAYTHNAVDNILIKLRDSFGDTGADAVPFVRLGNMDKIHPRIRIECWSRIAENFNSVAEIKSYVNSHPVVGTTCLAVNNNILTCEGKEDSGNAIAFSRICFFVISHSF